MKKESTQAQKLETEELMKEYNNQLQTEDEHSFPYVVYSDYSDYSECNC